MLYYNGDIPPYYFYLVPMHNSPPMGGNPVLPALNPAPIATLPQIPPVVPTFINTQSQPVVSSATSRVFKQPPIRRRSSNLWKFEEDILLCHLRDEKGLGWKEISLSFPNRTVNGCQLRYRRISSLNKPH